MKGKKILNFIFEYEQKVFVILFAVFFVGLVCGSYHFFTGEQPGSFSVFQASSTDVFSDAFLKNTVSLIICFLFGYSVVGLPFILFGVFYGGICIGTYISLFTYFYYVKGCIISAIILFPYYLVLIASLFFVAFSSIRLSAALYNVFRRGTRYISPNIYSKPHILKIVIFTSIVLVLTFTYAYVAIPILSKIL